jgi:hypothetical protein
LISKGKHEFSTEIPSLYYYLLLINTEEDRDNFLEEKAGKEGRGGRSHSSPGQPKDRS